jgi:hypothetical protein
MLPTQIQTATRFMGNRIREFNGKHSANQLTNLVHYLLLLHSIGTTLKYDAHVRLYTKTAHILGTKKNYYCRFSRTILYPRCAVCTPKDRHSPSKFFNIPSDDDNDMTKYVLIMFLIDVMSRLAGFLSGYSHTKKKTYPNWKQTQKNKYQSADFPATWLRK